jgi:hypothetical protein
MFTSLPNASFDPSVGLCPPSPAGAAVQPGEDDSFPVSVRVLEVPHCGKLESRAAVVRQRGESSTDEVFLPNGFFADGFHNHGYGMPKLLSLTPEHFFPRIGNEGERVLSLVLFVLGAKVFEKRVEGRAIFLTIAAAICSYHVFGLSGPNQVRGRGSWAAFGKVARWNDIVIERFRFEHGEVGHSQAIGWRGGHSSSSPAMSSDSECNPIVNRDGPAYVP